MCHADMGELFVNANALFNALIFQVIQGND